MASRVETYLHSDSITKHKGGAMVRVYCQTDFATKAEGFIAFAKNVALFAFAAQLVHWQEIIDLYPHLEQERLNLESKAGIGEKVWLGECAVFGDEGVSLSRTSVANKEIHPAALSSVDSHGLP